MNSRRLLLQAIPALLGGLAAGGAARPGGPLHPRTAAQAPPADQPGDALVRTRAGTVRGIARRGVRSFLGIPYGHVPGRFRQAEATAPWAGVRDAVRFGPVAPQRLAGAAEPISSSEQCLSLNVWSPVPAPPAVPTAALLPVMVWVHGGANVSGASLQPIYDGQHFARSGVVCVTFNYRLGVFGFLELGDVLGAPYRGSGNNALRDQVLALRWVRDNIAAFGGDPGRVTLAGQSAGAKDVAALVASPAARGLFHRFILESGGGRTVVSAEQAHEVASRYVELLGLSRPRASGLLRLDTERLIEAQHALMIDPPYSYPLRPVVDGRLLPTMPETAIALGCAARVPLLLGTNRDELRLTLTKDAASRPLAGHYLSNMDPGAFERMLMRYDASAGIRRRRDALLGVPPRDEISITAPDLAEIRWRALTAEEYWIPSVRVAEAQSGAGGDVWMYRFDKAAASGSFEGRAAHVSELPYVWNNPDDPELEPLVAGFDAALAARMHAAWVAFIAGGAPAADGLPEWPRYDGQTRTTMILDTRSRLENDPRRAERQLWSSLFLAATGR